MPLSQSRHFVVFGAFAFAAMTGIACEPSNDSTPTDLTAAAEPSSAPGTEAFPSRRPDAAAAAAPPLTARQLELARMQTHLDSLYAQSDVVHRFTTAGGDPVDCVPFEKQPGFSQVASSNGAAPVLAAQPGLARLSSAAGFGDGVDAAGNVRSCPSGAVPIRRWTIADLARFETLEDFLAKEPVHVRDQLDGLGFNHEHAYYSSSVPNWGAQVTLNVWNPAVEPNDFSLSQAWVFGGPEKHLQSVEGGYLAYPKLYGDTASRLFIYSTTDSYDVFNKTNCYDLGCKAFVQVADSHVLLGGKFDKTSANNGEQREFTLRWQFCPATECQAWEGWWLRYDGGAMSEWVGFYPRKRYDSPGLRDGGDRIDFGGEVAFVRGAAHTTTDMGSGQPASGGFGVAAYQSNLLRITTGHAWAGMGAMSNLDQAPTCYSAGRLISPPRIPTQTFFFGGTGYSEACK
ncbi:MAG: hypothetical protein JWP87_4244 [Labilithrix sp.]|nr:hypothetical protein [Labilithrix sp.]